MGIIEDIRRTTHIFEFTRTNEFLLDETYISSNCISGIIPRVPLQLLAVNQKAYLPHELGIGYYHNKGSSRFMQRCKIYWLLMFLQKYGIAAEEYENTMINVSDGFHSCYTSDITDDNRSSIFTDIMNALMFDGCFIFELIRKYDGAELHDTVFFSISATPLKLRVILRDMLLLENQIPFSVLKQVCEMTMRHDNRVSVDSFKTMVAKFLNDHLSKFCFISLEESALQNGNEEHEHLLGLVHTSWRPSSALGDCKMTMSYYLSHIQSATKLMELAAVKFRKVERQEHSNLFEVRFINGTLEFQTISVDNDTESLLLNMMAYEQLTPDKGRNYVTHYMQLMNCLIKSTEDVDLFCKCGIINGMGKDRIAILQFFSSFQVSMSDSCRYFFYFAEMDKMEDYCKRNRAKGKLYSWWVALKRDYFYSPWKILAVVGGFILLGLTLVQTLYAVLAYNNSNNNKK